MPWNYNDVNVFAGDIAGIQNNSAVRDEFMRGFMDASVMYGKLRDNTFNVDSAMRDSYEVMDACNTIITTEPMLDACGADVNLIPHDDYEKPVYYTPFPMSVAMEACKSRCTKDTLTQYIAKMEYKAGVAFGRKFDQIFFMGMPEIGERGITQQPGTQLFDMSTHSKYSDLASADPNAIANFFTYITSEMMNPRICMGSSAYELIGLRAMSSTGDSCSDLWDCVIERLNNRMMTENARTIFEFSPMWDHITGIDPADPTVTHSVIWAYDAAYLEMGLQDDEIVGGVITKGHDIAESKRTLFMSTPHVTKKRASRWVYGFVDHAAIVECEGERYNECGSIGLTLPTPIVE